MRRIFLALALPALCAPACSSSVDVPPEPECSQHVVTRAYGGSLARMDLLLDIDNSRSMADKQAILATTIPELVSWFANPPCVDGQGLSVQTSVGEPCPKGTERAIAPIPDIHIGVISTSIGSAGADGCLPGGNNAASVDDHGHLLA